MMTLLIILERINEGKIKWSDWVEISPRAAKTKGSILSLTAGDQLTVENLFKGILIKSGNDASTAIAEFISGSVEEFVLEMNRKAKELKLYNTNFINPHGMSKRNHYSSAEDLAKIALKLIENKEVLKNSSIKTGYIRNKNKWGKKIVNTNPFLGLIPEVNGLKTGVTNTSRYCIAVTATKNNKQLLLILIGAQTKADRDHHVRELLEYGFNCNRLN